MLNHELSELIDDRDRGEIALALRVSPCEETMTAEHDSVAPGVCFDCSLQHHCKLKTRPLPRHPDDAVAKTPIEFGELFVSVGARCKRDAPIRMEVIHVVERQESVQRSIDRSCNGIQPEGAERVQPHNFIFEIGAAIDILQSKKFVQIEGGKPRPLNAAQIASTSLYPQNASVAAIQRVPLNDFGTRVSTSEVRDSKVGAK